jgi:hypothetical protein
LQYIIANKNTITIEICKKRNTKKWNHFSNF